MAYGDLVASMDRKAIALLGGRLAIYTPDAQQLPLTLPAFLGMSSVSLTGIFDAQYVLAEGSAHAGVEASGPAIFFRVSDLPTDPEVDNPTITIGGVAYSVTFRKPDGMGGVVLGLRSIV